MSSISVPFRSCQISTVIYCNVYNDKKAFFLIGSLEGVFLASVFQVCGRFLTVTVRLHRCICKKRGEYRTYCLFLPNSCKVYSVKMRSLLYICEKSRVNSSRRGAGRGASSQWGPVVQRESKATPTTFSQRETKKNTPKSLYRETYICHQPFKTR